MACPGLAVCGQWNEVLQWTVGDYGTFMVYVDCNNTIWILRVSVENMKIEFEQGNSPILSQLLYNPKFYGLTKILLLQKLK